MANYYSRTVITECVLLTDELVSILEARGADVCVEGVKETVLDGLANDRVPLSSYSVVWSEGWTDPCDDADEFLVDYAFWDEERIDNASPEFRKLVISSEAVILREIAKVNPQKTYIEMQSSWSCSKMRLDGFGGSGLIVSLKGYLYITSNDYCIDEDGVIAPRSVFSPWDELEDPEG